MTWSDLPSGAKAFRIAHVIWSVLSLASLGYIWMCAFTRHRNRRVWAGVAFLSLEGLALVVGRGDCPFGPFQARLGDPVPLFELVLPPRAAKAAVPVLAGVSLAGLAAVVVRRPVAGGRGVVVGRVHRQHPVTALRRPTARLAGRAP